MIHLITGGVRAGKSRHALTLAETYAPAGPIAFVATATAGDEEMGERIRRHRAERDARYFTVEAPLALPEVLGALVAEVVVIDCLTLWITNLLLDPAQEGAIPRRVAALSAALAAERRPVLVVTNEVGLGIIPADVLSRRFQDELGRANAAVARIATRLTLLVAGVPLRVR